MIGAFADMSLRRAALADQAAGDGADDQGAEANRLRQDDGEALHDHGDAMPTASPATCNRVTITGAFRWLGRGLRAFILFPIGKRVTP